MQKNQSVILKSFNNLLEDPEPTDPSEDFWKLIGSSGVIIATADELNFHDKNRVLVKFDFSLDDLGLVNHNQFDNSLWILKSDLEDFVGDL